MADEQAVQQQDDAQDEKQQVTVEELSPVLMRLKIEVPAQQVAEKMSSSFSKLRDDAVVPGFRRGRVPMRLLQKRFGTSVRDDVRAQLITESYSQAIEDQGLDVVGEPDVKDIDKIELTDDSPLTFAVEVEVSPKVELPDFAAIDVTAKPFEVTDDDVQKEIDQQCKRFGSPEDISEGLIEADQVISGEAKILEGHDTADEPAVLGQDSEARVYVPGEDREFKGQVLGILVEDLGKRLIGAKVGDTVTIAMTGPDGHEDERIKDKPIAVVLEIQSAARLKLLPVEDLIRMWGKDTEEAFREDLQQLITQRRQQEQARDMQKQVCDHLLEQIDFELPQRLTSLQTLRILRRLAMDLAYQGLDKEEIEQQIAQRRQGSEAEARRQLKLFFILDQAAKSLDVEVTEAELNGRIAMLAMQQRRRPEKLRQEMIQKGEIDSLYILVREEKVLNKILEIAGESQQTDAESSNSGEATPAPETEESTGSTADEQASSPSSEPPSTKED